MNHPAIPRRVRALFASAVSLFFVSAAHAAVLVEYGFTNASPTSQASGVTGSAASWWTSSNTGFGGAALSAFTRADNLGSEFDDGKFLTFTITAAAGQVLNLQSFSFDLGGGVASGSAGTGPTAVVYSEVRASVGPTPYAAPLVLGSPDVTTATHSILNTDTTATYTRFSVDLSAPEFQGVESVSFRLYVASSSTSATRFLRFDNFSIEGTLAEASPIPEPSSVALLAGAAALGLVACKRRRSK